MAASTIDYDKLAAQHGGTATVDYDALAAQHGGTTQAAADAPVEKSLWQKAKDNFNANTQGAQPGDGAVKGFIENIGQGGGQTLRALAHPLDTLNAMGSSVAHPIDQAHAEVDTLRANPSRFIGNAIGQVGTGAILGEAVAPVADAVKTGAGKLTPAAMKESAGRLLQSVAGDANKIPVQLENSGDAAVRLMDWQGKTQLGPTVNKFLNRITKPNADPLTYSEARDYYQLLGKLSYDETSKLAPPVQRDLAQMVAGLKTDIGNSADQVGRAADYYKGMGDYAKGAKYQDWYDTVKGAAIKGAAGAAGVSVGYRLWKELTGK